MSVLAVTILTVSLLMVVVGHALLAQGQVRLSVLQHDLSAEQTLHRQRVLAVASLETPSRISQQAQVRFHMVQPTTVTQLPSVPLTTPIATPKLSAPPVAPPTTTTPTTTPSTTTPTTTTPSTTASGSAGQ